MKAILRFALVVAAILALAGCYYTPPAGNVARASLVPKYVPAGLVSIAVVVTGPGMAPIIQQINLSSSEVTLEIPSGANRTISLLLNTVSATLIGEATVDLQPGEARDLLLDPVLADTQIVLPDYLNNRIVQYADIQGTGVLTLVGSGIAGIGLLDARFRPYDVDFDRQGRMYIGNSVGGSGMGDNCVIRVNDVTGAGGLKFTEPEYDYGIVAVTVDRVRDLVYYAASATLTPPRKIYRANLDGSGAVSRDVTVGVEAVQTIQGMAVDEAGQILIAGKNAGGVNRVFRYDPVGQTVLAVYGANLNEPWDVLVKSPYLYVANRLGAAGFKVLRLNSDFSSPVGYGLDASTANTNPGYFYGPSRFVAILSRKITLIDDRDLDNLDKVVSMEDIAGTDWATLPASGDGQSLFRFYFMC